MFRVSLTSLQAFERVAALGSQRAAAESLGVTQAAVSHAVRSLEARLECPLFQRHGRGLVLTEKGAELAQRLSAAFGEIEHAVTDFREGTTTPTLAVTPALSSCWLAPRLARAVRDGQAPDFKLIADRALTPLGEVGGADLAVRYSSRELGEHLYTDHFHAVYRPSEEADPDQLPSLLIETEWQTSEDFAPCWDDWFRAAQTSRPTRSRTMRYTDESEAVQAALSGGGMALLGSAISHDLIHQGMLKIWRPGISVPGPSYWLVHREAGEMRPETAKVADWLRAQFSTMDQPA